MQSGPEKGRDINHLVVGLRLVRFRHRSIARTIELEQL